MDSSQHENRIPWAAVAESAQYEDCLIGNREGLVQLRDAIDSAISNGEAQLPAMITDMMKILVLDSPSNPESVPPKRGWRDAIALLTCGLALFVLLLLLVFGILYLRKQ